MLKNGLRLIALGVLLVVLVLGLNHGKTLAPSNEDAGETPLAVTKEYVNLRSYFPVNSQWEYDFFGEGNEFASFTREIKYTDGTFAQVFDTTSGAMVTTVYRVTENEIAIVQDSQETESKENILDQLQIIDEPRDVLLRQPLEPGNTWKSRDGTRKIVAINEIVEVAAGVFYDVVVIEIDYDYDPDVVSYEYYAKNIGLIKREYRARNGDFTVITQLSRIIFH